MARAGAIERVVSLASAVLYRSALPFVGLISSSRSGSEELATDPDGCRAVGDDGGLLQDPVPPAPRRRAPALERRDLLREWSGDPSVLQLISLFLSKDSLSTDPHALKPR